MPTTADLDDLERVHQEIQSLEMKHPEAFDDVVELFKRNRSIGYKNICRMLMGEATPKQLKGIED